MRRKSVYIVFSCLLLLSIVLASSLVACSTKTSQTTTTTTAISTTTTAAGNWWDKLGVPQYGGTLTISSPQDIGTWDANAPGATPGAFGLENVYQERLTSDDWTLDPTVYNYETNWRPSDYVVGNIAQSWEMPDASTYVLHLRHGVTWQNIPR